VVQWEKVNESEWYERATCGVDDSNLSLKLIMHMFYSSRVGSFGSVLSSKMTA